MASISSSPSSLFPDGSSPPPDIKGIAGWVYTFKASARLDITAGDPMTWACRSMNYALTFSGLSQALVGWCMLQGIPAQGSGVHSLGLLWVTSWAVCLPAPGRGAGCRPASCCSVVAFWVLLLLGWYLASNCAGGPTGLTGKLVAEGRTQSPHPVPPPMCGPHGCPL